MICGNCWDLCDRGTIPFSNSYIMLRCFVVSYCYEFIAINTVDIVSGHRRDLFVTYIEGWNNTNSNIQSFSQGIDTHLSGPFIASWGTCYVSILCLSLDKLASVFRVVSLIDGAVNITVLY